MTTKFHEEYEGYKALGITDTETMLKLSKSGVNVAQVRMFNNLGFSHVQTLEKLCNEFDGFDSGYRLNQILGPYVEAGFAGNAEAIIELVGKNRDDGRREVDPKDVLFFAEHGLKGNKKAMLDISPAISCETLEKLAYRIAFRLANEDISYVGFIHKDRYGEGHDYAVNLRKKFAEQIPISSLVALTQYNFGEEEAENSHPIRVELKKACGKKYMFEKTGQKEAVEEIEKEIRDLNDKSHEKLDEINRLKDNKLMEAYTTLVEQGVDAFKGKYKLNEGWIYDKDNILYYNGSIAIKLLQEKWEQEDREVMEMYK